MKAVAPRLQKQKENKRTSLYAKGYSGGSWVVVYDQRTYGREGAVTGEPVLPHHGSTVGQFILWDNGGWTVGPIQG